MNSEKLIQIAWLFSRADHYEALNCPLVASLYREWAWRVGIEGA